MITLDTHNDINPNYFTAECNYTMPLTNQVNLPKMVAGGLDVSFFIVYVGQGALTPEGYDNAYKQAVEKFDAIHRLAEVIAPDKIGLALTAADVRKIAASGRKVAVIGIENGYPIGEDIKRVKEFYDRGGRYLSLAHNGHSQLADSNTGEANNQWAHNGLSPLGKQVIEEANRLGIMVDISHPSKQANLQAMALSKAPVIASHSGSRAIANHSRNLDDEQLLALKKNGGVAQAVALAGYVKVPVPSAERQAAIAKLEQEFSLPAGSVGGRGGRGGRGAAGGPTNPPGCTSQNAARGGGGVVVAAEAEAAAGEAPRWRRCPLNAAPSWTSSSKRSTRSSRRLPVRTSRTSSITSTTSSRRSASITWASRPTSMAAAGSTAGTTPARPST